MVLCSKGNLVNGLILFSHTQGCIYTAVSKLVICHLNSLLAGNLSFKQFVSWESVILVVNFLEICGLGCC